MTLDEFLLTDEQINGLRGQVIALSFQRDKLDQIITMTAAAILAAQCAKDKITIIDYLAASINE